MLQEWLQAVGSNYHSVAWKAEEGPRWGWEGTTPRCTPPPCTSPLHAHGVLHACCCQLGSALTQADGMQCVY